MGILTGGKRMIEGFFVISRCTSRQRRRNLHRVARRIRIMPTGAHRRWCSSTNPCSTGCPRALVPASPAVVVVPSRVDTLAGATGLGVVVRSQVRLIALLTAAAAVPLVGLEGADGKAVPVAAGLPRSAHVPAAAAVIVVIQIVHAPTAAAEVVHATLGVRGAAVLLVGQDIPAPALYAGGVIAYVVAGPAVVQVAGGIRADPVAALRPLAAPQVAPPAVVIVELGMDAAGSAHRGAVDAGADAVGAGCICPAPHAACIAVLRIERGIGTVPVAAGLANGTPGPAAPAVIVVMEVILACVVAGDLEGPAG